MTRLVLTTFASALLGVLLGAAVVAWRLSPSAAVLATQAPDTTDLEQRLASVERAVATIEARVRAVRAGDATAASSPGTRAAPAANVPAGGDVHPVDTPVFEAAVVDLIERAAEDREQERAAAKDERRQQKARAWADALTSRLGLSPEQAERLLAVQAELDGALERERVRSNTPDAPYAAKEERRAARQALRESAERRLRALLSPAQLETYGTLDDRLKLYRPKDSN